MNIRTPGQEILDKLSDRHIRVAVVGNVDAGKSTLIGTIASATLDDGRGSGRSYIMKHKHEMQSGRTSCIASHIIEYNESGHVMNAIKKKPAQCQHHTSEPEVSGGPGRCVTLLDMAGHEKYLKTTISGISSGMADYAIVLVNAMQPPTHMTFHHLNLCVSSGIPVIVVLTKVNCFPPLARPCFFLVCAIMMNSPQRLTHP